MNKSKKKASLPSMILGELPIQTPKPGLKTFITEVIQYCPIPKECQKESKRSIRRQKRSTRMKKGIGRQKLKVDMSWSTFLRENSPWVRMMD
ncbi:hypothetical protein ES703_99178 [subsurface metagenome]